MGTSFSSCRSQSLLLPVFFSDTRYLPSRRYDFHTFLRLTSTQSTLSSKNFYAGDLKRGTWERPSPLEAELRRSTALDKVQWYTKRDTNMWTSSVVAFASLALLPSVLATDILKTSGVSDCNNGTSSIKVNNVDISFDRSTNNIDFDVSGTSEQVQYVTAELIVKAYGVQVYQKEFDPCSSDTRVDQLCPVPKGTFAANGT